MSDSEENPQTFQSKVEHINAEMVMESELDSDIYIFLGHG